MSIILPLDQMSTEEKLQAMEDLWTHLTRNEQEFDSPAWHESVLAEREERLRTGQEKPIEAVAKKEFLDLLTNSSLAAIGNRD